MFYENRRAHTPDDKQSAGGVGAGRAGELHRARIALGLRAGAGARGHVRPSARGA